MYRHVSVALLVTAVLCWGDTISVVEKNPTIMAGHTVTVSSPGNFECSFTRGNGFGKTWFDLKNDPLKTRNLGPHTVSASSALFWVKFHTNATSASFEPNPADSMKVLEASPVRTRIRLKGTCCAYGTPSSGVLNGFLFEQIFTLYPNGNIYISYIMETAKDESYTGEAFVITHSTGKWGNNALNEIYSLNQNGPDPTAFTAWHLQHSNGPTYYTDILMTAKSGKHGTGYWDEGYLDEDYRTAFRYGHPWDTGDYIIHAGKHPLYFFMRFADDMNDIAAGNRYSNDYRTPDVLSVAEGQTDKSDAGDTDADGFNEAEGCYVLTAGASGARFSIKGTETITRTNPAFKIKNWNWAVPTTIQWAGQVLQAKQDYNAAHTNGSLVLQVFKSFGNTSVDVAITGSGVKPHVLVQRVVPVASSAPMRVFDVQGRLLGTCEQGRLSNVKNHNAQKIGPDFGKGPSSITFGVVE